MELSVLNLFLVLLIAWLSGQLAARFGYPSVLGELVAGILLGPPLLGLLEGSAALAVIADLGILVMMLYIGMEIDPKELSKASKGGILAALGGFVTPFVLCYLAMIWFGASQTAAVFVGISAGVTSLATKSRILVDLRLLDTRIAHMMMAGALIADTISLVLFAAVIGVAEIGSLDVTELARIVIKAALYIAAAALAGIKVLPWVARRLEGLGPTPTFTFVLLIGLLYAGGAELAGMHGILGAFLAGLFLREQVFGRTLSQRLVDLVRHASIGFLAPVFFVTAGFSVTLDVLASDTVLLLVVIALATIGKIVGTAVFYLPTGYGWREGLVIGSGMNGRGAVEIIVAEIGLTAGLISQDVFSILVFMAIATTAADPVLLKWGASWLRNRGELARSQADRKGVLIVGAGPTARLLGRVLARSQTVHVVDKNSDRCRKAIGDGLEAVQGDALDERVMARAGASYVRLFIALTPNAEVNALTARMAREVFQIPEILIVSAGDEEGHAALAAHVHASTLFAGPVRLADWDFRVHHEEAETTGFMSKRSLAPDELFREVGKPLPAIPFILRRGERYEPFHSRVQIREDDHVILLRVNRSVEIVDRFDRFAARAAVLDIDPSLDAAEFFQAAAGALAADLGEDADDLAERFHDRESTSSTVLLPGLAVPHVELEGEGRFGMLLARCRGGVSFPGRQELVHALFVLAGTKDERNFHLRALAAIATIAQAPDFEHDWLLAPDAEALRDIVLRAPRRRVTQLV